MAETEPLLHHQDSQMDPQIHPAYSSHNHEQYQPTPLELYRNAIGIGPRRPYFSSSKTPTGDPTFPRGLYKRILNDHRRLQIRYYLFDALLTASLVTQLVVGATLTGLGPAAGDHPRAITVLGAVNTGVAGLLGLLKGNGLPDRLRKDGFELRKVLDYIEEMDAELASGVLLSPGDIDISSDPNAPNDHNSSAEHDSTDHTRREKEREEVLEIVKQVILKYEAARDTAENNRPESYVVAGIPVSNASVSPSGRV